jgi:hypothetical protein
MSVTDREYAVREIANAADASAASVTSPIDPIDENQLLASLDLSSGALNQALRDVAHEELNVVRARYFEHADPVRCAVGISLVLRSLAKDLFGEERIRRLRQVSWLNFLLRTSNSKLLRPDVLETMSAALYGVPPEMDLPRDCSFWFEAAEGWIDHQRNQSPITPCPKPFEVIF